MSAGLDTDYRYPLGRRLIHWAIAALLILQVSLILVFKQLQSLEMGQFVLNAHRQCGLFLLLAVIARMVFMRGRRPRDVFPLWQQLFAKATHFLLYASLAAQSALGILLSWSRGDEVSLFGVGHLPMLVKLAPSNTSFLHALHVWNVSILALLLSVHVFAVIYHRVAHNVSVMERMVSGGGQNRLVNRMPLSLQLVGVCGVILGLSTASGLYGASRFKSFDDLRTRFSEKDQAHLDLMRSAMSDLKSVAIRLSQDSRIRPT